MPFADELPGYRAAYQAWLRSARPLLEAEQYVAAFADYPWVEPTDTPFTPLLRPLSQVRLGILSTAGFYVPGLQASFNVDAVDGDTSYRVLPVDVQPASLVATNTHVSHDASNADWNVVLPLDHLRTMLSEGDLAQIGPVFSIDGFALDAGTLAATTAEGIAAALRAGRCDALLVVHVWPMCHQSGGLVARAAERAGIATVVIDSSQEMAERMRYARTLITPHGFGQTLGPPGDHAAQRATLQAALDLLRSASPGEIRQVEEPVVSPEP